MIAREFSRLVLEHCSVNELEQVLEQKAEIDAKHILTAFESVMGTYWSEEYAELTNTAWDLAIKNKFYINQ